MRNTALRGLLLSSRQPLPNRVTSELPVRSNLLWSFGRVDSGKRVAEFLIPDMVFKSEPTSLEVFFKPSHFTVFATSTGTVVNVLSTPQ